MANFKIWMESEPSLGAGVPEMQDRGSDTPASDEVKRTNLQPQVDAQEPEAAREQDQIAAIDSDIEHLEEKLPHESGPKINQFRKLWDNLKQKWDKIKMDQEVHPEEQGLGDSAGDPKFLKAMQQFPNMMPISNQHGGGIFGAS